MNDPFVEAERAKRALAAEEESRAAEQKAKAYELYEALEKYNDKLRSYGVEFQLIRFTESAVDRNKHSVLVYFRVGQDVKDFGKINSILYRHDYRGHGKFQARGGVLEDAEWDEEAHRFRNVYMDCPLGRDVDGVVSALAASIVKGDLPAPGTYMDRLYNVADWEAIKGCRAGRTRPAAQTPLDILRANNLLKPAAFIVVIIFVIIVLRSIF